MSRLIIDYAIKPLFILAWCLDYIILLHLFSLLQRTSKLQYILRFDNGFVKYLWMKLLSKELDSLHEIMIPLQKNEVINISCSISEGKKGVSNE